MAFTCPACSAVSHHPEDEAEGYCGRCHKHTAPTRGGLPLVVIYSNPFDYPGRYVARIQWAMPGGVVQADKEPLVVVDTLEQARAAVPGGMTMLPRDPRDEPQIVEVWL